jgi:hypothetical protein
LCSATAPRSRPAFGIHHRARVTGLELPQPQTPRALLGDLLPRLLRPANYQQAIDAPSWLDLRRGPAAPPDDQTQAAERAAAWPEARLALLTRLNEQRESLRRTLTRPLILILPREEKADLRALCPDLWAIRQFTVQTEDWLAPAATDWEPTPMPVASQGQDQGSRLAFPRPRSWWKAPGRLLERGGVSSQPPGMQSGQQSARRTGDRRTPGRRPAGPCRLPGAPGLVPATALIIALYTFICGTIRFRNPLTGLIMSEDIRGYCWNCGHGLTRLDLGRETDCPGCNKPTHCCRNCRHFAPGRPNECMEPQVERVVDKIRSNFCEFFEPNPKAPTDTAVVDADALRRAAELLFGPRQ